MFNRLFTNVLFRRPEHHFRHYQVRDVTDVTVILTSLWQWREPWLVVASGAV